MTNAVSPRNKPTIEVRPVTPDDHEAWLSLWLGYQSFYGVEIDHATSGTTWGRMLDGQIPMWCDMAFVAGRPAGIAHSLAHLSTWTMADYCHLQDLFVAPNHRGQGVGRALIEAVYARAASMKMARVWWLTHHTNVEAMQLYDRLAQRSGFEQYRHLFD